MEENRCPVCGCYLEHIDNSYLSEGGWYEDESYVCNNSKCELNNPSTEGNI